MKKRKKLIKEFPIEERRIQERIQRINAILDYESVDLDALRTIAVEEGLVNNELRSRAWPKLLAIKAQSIPENYNKMDYVHKDLDQVAKDIDRSLWRFTKGKAKKRNKLRIQLSRIINAILSRNPSLHYYQGYHDLASIFLLVAPTEEQAFAMMEKLSLNHVSYALQSSLDTTKKLLSLLFPLISFAEPNLHNYFLQSGVEPFFALSWVLTWFSHGFDDLDTIARLFDFFIASHPLMPLYLGAEIILHFRDQLLQNVECEYSAIHIFLTNIPQNLPFDKLIHKAVKLFEKVPPKKLQAAARQSLGSGLISSFPYPWMKEQKHSNWITYVKNYLYQPIRKTDTSLGWEGLLFYCLLTFLFLLGFISFVYPKFFL